MKTMLIAISLVVTSGFSVAASANCNEQQNLTLIRYAEAGVPESKVDTAHITVTPDSTIIENLTGSADLIVTLDEQQVPLTRNGETYTLNRSIRGASEVAILFKDAPTKIGGENWVGNLYDPQGIRENKNGCLYLIELSEH